MNIETIKSVYFVGAGGIGMSALVRYFLSRGKFVAGYKRTATGNAAEAPPDLCADRVFRSQVFQSGFQKTSRSPPGR